MKLSKDMKTSIINIGVGNVSSLENADYLGVNYDLKVKIRFKENYSFNILVLAHLTH